MAQGLPDRELTAARRPAADPDAGAVDAEHGRVHLQPRPAGVRVVATASGRVEFTGTGYAPEGELLVAGRPLGDGPLRAEVTRASAPANLPS